MSAAKSRVIGSALIGLQVLMAGCLGWTPANVPLERYDPDYGYLDTHDALFREPGRVSLALAFSGGGTRAAALAYGVLLELHETPIAVDGVEKSLLDEVDLLSGVSGGSFPAAYYGLFGDRIFPEFEERFLRKNVQGALVWQAIRPWNLLRLFTPWLSRSDLASRYYDSKVYDGATFRDLKEAGGPRVNINATDLSSGERFTFNQETFSVICSDLDALSIAVGVASSSAVPMLLSPITLRNHAGECGFEPPAWVERAIETAGEDPRRARSARNFAALRDSKAKPYIHLVDGGVSDNLGLRASMDFVTSAGGAKGALAVRGAQEVPSRFSLIIVNAETDPDPRIDLANTAPSFAAMMNAVSGGQIRRYNFETLMLANNLVEQWARELSTPDRPVVADVILVDFDSLEDEEERRYFKRLPTSFKLSDDQVDRLIAIGRERLRASPRFQALVASFR